ncbi:hypothetical protein BDQ12DRAFT_689358 [Crucibulum laeve]|uniref:DUF6699 domain-containing protein n=1 Tax=Crucibulum laeve TaxID=68775 RepID=A0A5C3LPD0_9AGAR|nr:hypothetical protein BDQ12DRAFT_689358 [Crucibulum laeve]
MCPIFHTITISCTLESYFPYYYQPTGLSKFNMPKAVVCVDALSHPRHSGMPQHRTRCPTRGILRASFASESKGQQALRSANGVHHKALEDAKVPTLIKQYDIQRYRDPRKEGREKQSLLRKAERENPCVNRGVPPSSTSNGSRRRPLEDALGYPKLGPGLRRAAPPVWFRDISDAHSRSFPLHKEATYPPVVISSTPGWEVIKVDSNPLSWPTASSYSTGTNSVVVGGHGAVYIPLAEGISMVPKIHPDISTGRFRWDLLHRFETARSVHEGKEISRRLLYTSAFDPPKRTASLEFANYSADKWSNDALKPLNISKNRDIIVQDILEAIQSYFHESLEYKEYRHISKEKYKQVLAAYTQRTGQQSSGGKPLRVDMLTGCTFFSGLDVVGCTHEGNVIVSFKLGF